MLLSAHLYVQFDGVRFVSKTKNRPCDLDFKTSIPWLRVTRETLLSIIIIIIIIIILIHHIASYWNGILWTL